MSRSSLLALLVLVGGSWAAAQEGSDKEAAKPDDIASLIKQLDADSFSDRQNASAKLAAAAEKAIPALEKAAASESRETSMRAFDILKGHFEKGQPEAKDAARQALERISKGDLGAASRRASEALTPPTPATPNLPGNARPALPFGAVPGGGIRIAGARIAIAAGGVAGGVETKIKVENGVKTTEVKDKERRVKIIDDPDKGLQLEVTETKDGKEETKKYEAKNADELKTKNPEAHKIFEQYSAKGAEIKIGGFGFAPADVRPALPGVPMAIPAPAPIAPPIRVFPAPFPAPLIPADKPGIPDEKLRESFDSLEKALREAESSLKDAAKMSDSEELKRSQERLEKVRKELEQLRALFK
jgi:hypothetical protein